MLATALLAGFLLASPSGEELHVSARTGDDTVGEGTAEAPFRTLTRALAAARSAGDDAPLIRIDMGTYDTEAGEVFPLELPPLAQIVGRGSELCELAGDGEGPLLIARDAAGARRALLIAGLTLRGATTGLSVESTPSEDVTWIDSLRLDDVHCKETGTGVSVSLRPFSSEAPCRGLFLNVSGFRATDCETGMAVRGTSELVLEIEDSLFRGCGNGLLFEAALSEDPDRYAGPPVHHDVTVRRTRFEACRGAGVLRRGAAGKNAARPYLFEDCDFRGNDVGIHMMRPAADSPLIVRRSRFLENVHFGLQVSGWRGDSSQLSLIEDCTFRWNGVGLHLVNMQVVYELRRNRILDNLGTGVFCANFMSEPTTAVFANNLIARNGAAGLYCLADAKVLSIHVVHSTIVDNMASGIERKNRHSGKSSFEVRGCIVAGNTPDLSKIDATEVFGSLVGDGSGSGVNDNLEGDPGFDVQRRGYRLGAGSPCIDRGSEAGRRLAGSTDLDGKPRGVGPLDLGALERQPKKP
ncbi:MAG: right-handed parallel beta-helix repeat-containing protein [Planctomycetota bacterium]|nr:right-handed parallel beta-helix repeat-containing protein [Planctomycetota bacterium]